MKILTVVLSVLLYVAYCFLDGLEVFYSPVTKVNWLLAGPPGQSQSQFKASRSTISSSNVRPAVFAIKKTCLPVYLFRQSTKG